MSANMNTHQQNDMPPPMAYKKEAAAKADLDSRIDTTGQYIGAFTKVKYQYYPSGSAGYVFDFKSSHGQEAQRMFICTVNTTGECNEIGENKVAAIMCCMGVQSAQASTATVQEYDFKAGMDVPVQVWLYPEAMNKPIGLVLQKELFTNSRTGKDAYRMVVVVAFHPGTGRTAKEMIDGEQTGTRVPEMLTVLGDSDKRTSGATQASGNQATNDQQAASQAARAAPADFDDDIPF